MYNLIIQNSASPCLIVDNKVVLSYTGKKKHVLSKLGETYTWEIKKLAWLQGWSFNGRVTLLAGPTILHIINTLAYLAESTQSMPELQCRTRKNIMRWTYEPVLVPFFVISLFLQSQPLLDWIGHPRFLKKVYSTVRIKLKSVYEG